MSVAGKCIHADIFDDIEYTAQGPRSLNTIEDFIKNTSSTPGSKVTGWIFDTNKCADYWLLQYTVTYIKAFDDRHQYTVSYIKD